VGTFQDARFPLTVDGSVPTGMLNGSSGATLPRTQGDRLGSWVKDVKDFGAVGDSNATASTGTDDTAAIQAAVAAVEAQGGGVIFFPPGTYKVTEAITFEDNTVKYIFRGVGNARLSGGEDGGSCIVGDFEGFLLDRPNLNTSGARVVIEQLGLRNQHSSGSCIRMLGVGASTISHCSIQAKNWGIKMGGLGSPASATFTGNSSGTTLTASSVTGTIDSATFPCPISGTGVVLDTVILSQSSGTPGGAGNYITDIASTCSGDTVTTHPNAPTAFTCVVEHCVINGGGSYNADPDLSFTGVGIQLGSNSFVRECHLNNWGTAIRTYGPQSGVSRSQLESNTNAIRVGMDGEGNNHLSTALTISDCSLESNYRGIWLNLANQITIQSNVIQVTVDGSHNSLYGILIDGAADVKIESTIISGTVDTGGFGIYLGGATGEIRRIRAEACNLKSISKDASVNYSCMTAVQASGIGVLSCTLSQLNTAISAGDVVPGENRFITDANVALGSQTYGAVVTGGSSNFARVYWDSADVRYG
jgi:hypothetical protein